MRFCATCDGPFYEGAPELVVFGAGNSGLEEGLFLTKFAEHVTVIDRSAAAAGSKILIDKVTAHPQMTLRLSTSLVSFNAGDNGKLASLSLADADIRAGSTKQLASAVGEGASAAMQIRYHLQQRDG